MTPERGEVREYIINKIQGSTQAGRQAERRMQLEMHEIEEKGGLPSFFLDRRLLGHSLLGDYPSPSLLRPAGLACRAIWSRVYLVLSLIKRRNN